MEYHYSPLQCLKNSCQEHFQDQSSFLLYWFYIYILLNEIFKDKHFVPIVFSPVFTCHATILLASLSLHDLMTIIIIIFFNIPKTIFVRCYYYYKYIYIYLMVFVVVTRFLVSRTSRPFLSRNCSDKIIIYII